MLYPLYVHKEEGTSYSGTFPDFPGCFAAADELVDLPAAAQAAVEAHFGFDDDPIPSATPPQQWVGHADHIGGVWLMVDIDLAKVRSRRTLPEQNEDRILIPHAVVSALTDGATLTLAWRKHLGLTQADVAERIGVAPAVYAELEDRAELEKSDQVRIAEAMNISVGQLTLA